MFAAADPLPARVPLFLHARRWLAALLLLAIAVPAQAVYVIPCTPGPAVAISASVGTPLVLEFDPAFCDPLAPPSATISLSSLSSMWLDPATPPGFTLTFIAFSNANTGTLSGTPSSPGTYDFTVFAVVDYTSQFPLWRGQRGSSQPYTLTVKHAPTLTLTADQSWAETAATLTATLTDGAAPSGTIAFSLNGSVVPGCEAVPLSGNDASCTTANLPVGSATVGADYSGDTSHWGATASGDLVIATRPSAQLTLVRPVVAGQSVSGTLRGSDPEGDALTYAVVTPPAHGTLTLDDPATGRFTYTADATASGRDTFSFRVGDATGGSAVQSVYLTIHPSGSGAVEVGDVGAGLTGSWRGVVALAAGALHRRAPG